MKILTVVGARPQFIKAAALSRVLRDIDGAREVLVHTGQHFDSNMSAVFFEELDIPVPAYSLGINGGTHGEMTGSMLAAIERVLIEEQPDWVLVYGDTNSTLAGGLAAAKLHIPVAHVEAGLRSFNRRMPEEINRVLTDHLSDLLFAPTGTAMANLATEGMDEDKARLVGDIMYDAALYYASRAKSRFGAFSEELGVESGRFAVATIHRAENTDDEMRLRKIVERMYELSSELPVVWPVHPRTRQKMQNIGIAERVGAALHLTDPVSYLDMVALEQNAALVVTDSGGVQKEAFFFRSPCITLRTETEWRELVEGGYNMPLDPEEGDVAAAAGVMLSRQLDWEKPLYGEGDTAEQICNILLSDG